MPRRGLKSTQLFRIALEGNERPGSLESVVLVSRPVKEDLSELVPNRDGRNGLYRRLPEDARSFRTADPARTISLESLGSGA